MKKYLILLATLHFFLGIPAAIQAKTLPPELSADFVLYQERAAFDSGKLYMGRNAARMDFTKKIKQTHIYRFDSDKIEAWMHGGNLIVEMKMQYNALIDYKPAGFSEECLGEETVDGHPCQKCVTSGTFMGTNVKATVWKAKDLSGMVIKSRDGRGNGMEIKNIVAGPQPYSLFQAPAGYRRMSMPEGFGDMLKGMAK